MHKAACHSDVVDSLNPRRWRGERLHHHGGGVCWLFVLLWMDSWCHELIVCKKWYKNNLKMRLTTLLFDPPRRAPHRLLPLVGVANSGPLYVFPVLVLPPPPLSSMPALVSPCPGVLRCCFFLLALRADPAFPWLNPSCACFFGGGPLFPPPWELLRFTSVGAIDRDQWYNGVDGVDICLICPGVVNVLGVLDFSVAGIY